VLGGRPGARAPPNEGLRKNKHGARGAGTGQTQRLREANSVLITTHAKPDGDALGSTVALARALSLLGKDVQRWIMPPVQPNLARLADGDQLHLCEDESTQPTDEPDAIVVVDTGAWSQLAPMKSWLQARRDRITIVDHHLRGDDSGAWRYIDSSAAAAAEIVAELIDELAVEYDPTIRDAIYVGIASDTGWFRFSNTSARTHRLAARLIEAGVDHADLYTRLEQSERPEKLALQIRAMDSLKLLADGQVAVMVLRADDFRETGATISETERFVDIPQSVASVQMVALITEPPADDDGSDGKPAVRISFRSKPTPDAIDVAALAERFGGGGHARAAGAKLDAPIDEVIRQIETTAIELVRSPSL